MDADGHYRDRPVNEATFERFRQAEAERRRMEDERQHRRAIVFALMLAGIVIVWAIALAVDRWFVV